MNKIRRIAREIERADFDLVTKIGFSVVISMLWVFLLAVLSRMWHILFSELIPSVLWFMITLPVFGVLYHKLFTLIDARNLQDLTLKGQRDISKKAPPMLGNGFIFGRPSYNRLPSIEERLRSLKAEMDQDPLARVQIFNGNDATALEVFKKVFGNDPNSLVVTCLSDMRAATPKLKYLYLDTSTVDERDINEIAFQIKRINEIKMFEGSRSISKEGEQVE
ncbi:hypothetical protein [Enterococcus sp. DIV0187]|uniref:hypothetical protein n=1 Tax=Enterococcus sp. DIV0187 TaxID=2774644 RepID=UPI003F27F7A5